MEKSCRKCVTKASPRPLFNFGNNPKQPLHARNLFKNKIFWKRIIKKPVTLFLPLNPVPFNGPSSQKQKGTGTKDKVTLQITKEVQKNYFISYMFNDII